MSWTQVGRVKSAHGIKGDLYITLNPRLEIDLSKISEFKLSRDDVTEQKVFNVCKVNLHKSGVVIQSDNIIDRTAAEKFKGYQVEFSTEFVDNSSEFLPIGYKLIHGNETIGTIKDIVEHSSQRLILTDDEKLIPYVDEFIVSVDESIEVIHLNLPEGLLDSQDESN